MPATLYAALHVAPTASLTQIRRAYRRLALKYHPDSNQDDLPLQQCEAYLKQLSNALEVLSNTRLRALYDRLGADGLVGHSFKDAHVVFNEFFGTANPFAAVLTPGVDNDAMSAMSADRAVLDPARATNGAGSFKRGRNAIVELPLTLEEIFNGCQKRIRVKRQRITGLQPIFETKFLTVQVPPGTVDGTEIRFCNEGDEQPGCLPSDIIFRVQSVPHKVYQRQGNNLVCHKRVPLIQALTQCVLSLKTLDNRTLSVACHQILSPQTQKVLPGEGMPIPPNLDGGSTPGSPSSRSTTLGTTLPSLRAQPKKRGDLIINFDIEFPTKLSQEQKCLLHQALDPSRH